jgi:hypothetical protein
MARTIFCDTCGIDEAVLRFDSDRVCRDCFAGCVAGVITSQIDDEDMNHADFDAALLRGYEDADLMLNGGRLPY